MPSIRSFRELQVYEAAVDAAMDLFELTKEFSQEERNAMIDQMRYSSRSVCANIAEAWRRRRSTNYFQSKLGKAESEAEETRVWIEFAYRCQYLDAEKAKDPDGQSDQVIGQLVPVRSNADDWTLRT